MEIYYPVQSFSKHAKRRKLAAFNHDAYLYFKMERKLVNPFRIKDIASQLSSKMRYVHYSDLTSLPDLSGLHYFKCVVVIEEAVDDEIQRKLSHWLVNSGCLYMMAWGINCSSWDDSIDEASLAIFGDNEIPLDRFVTTTWHENETLHDVFWFAKHSAFNQFYDLNMVVFHLGGQPSERNFKAMYQGV